MLLLIGDNFRTKWATWDRHLQPVSCSPFEWRRASSFDGTGIRTQSSGGTAARQQPADSASQLAAAICLTTTTIAATNNSLLLRLLISGGHSRPARLWCSCCKKSTGLVQFVRSVWLAGRSRKAKAVCSSVCVIWRHLRHITVSWMFCSANETSVIPFGAAAVLFSYLV